ncbi:MAG: hypothetical protein O7B99_09670 [Planctomycetota bacterium]|nr:hypothetical protein [Planctomycetota bacterium]
MIAEILLLALPSPFGFVPVPVGAPPGISVDERQDEYAERYEAAANDVAKLWELALWCEAQELNKEMRKTCERILELAVDHEGAHKKLRHHSYDGKWFATYTELSRHRRAEEKRMLEEHGLVRWRDGWVLQTDLAFVRMGWVKEEEGSGKWVSPNVLAKRERGKQLAEEGWQQQDLVWVHPDDFEKWEAGLWKCGEEWLETEAANAYHAELASWWEVPGEYFVALSTCDRESTGWAAWWADQTYEDLVRAVGMHPGKKLDLVVLASLAQYNLFAAGDANLQLPPTEAAGWSSVHYAFLAESWIDYSQDPAEYRGGGVCYWDTDDESLKAFGQHAVRHAAAHSFLEAVDPSWNAVSEAIVAGNPGAGVDNGAFWSEKGLPAWLRYGIASYCERYFRDRSVGEGGNPWWARDWALNNLNSQGGLGPLDEVFQFGLDAAEAEKSARKINTAGAIVSFILDGGCKAVRERHQALKLALRSGGDTKAAAEALEQALRDNEDELLDFVTP